MRSAARLNSAAAPVCTILMPSVRCWPAGRSGPFQARKDRASHHPVLVALRQEAHLFGEMGDALTVACLGERVCDVGTPMAALRTEGVEQALQVHRHVAER